MYYTPREIEQIKQEVDHYEKVRTEVKMASGDYIDLKMYEPAMRHLIDTYIRAEESKKISAFDDITLIQLIVERGVDALKDLPEGISSNKGVMAETIENNLVAITYHDIFQCKHASIYDLISRQGWQGVALINGIIKDLDDLAE